MRWGERVRVRVRVINREKAMNSSKSHIHTCMQVNSQHSVILIDIRYHINWQYHSTIALSYMRHSNSPHPPGWYQLLCLAATSLFLYDLHLLHGKELSSHTDVAQNMTWHDMIWHWMRWGERVRVRVIVINREKAMNSSKSHIHACKSTLSDIDWYQISYQLIVP